MSSAAATAIDVDLVHLQECYVAAARMRQLDSLPANILALQDAHSALVLYQLKKAIQTQSQQSLIADLNIDPESPEGQRETALEIAARDAWLKAHSRPAEDLGPASYRFGEAISQKFYREKRIFLKMLRITGSVVGGSLPLQAVVGAKWLAGDLDLYVPENRRDALPMWQGFLTAAGYNVETVQVKAAPYMKAKNPRLGNSINSVITYRGCGLYSHNIIQLIHCKSIPRVLNAVDLSCTTFFHNGERMLSLDDPTLAEHHVAFLRYPLEELNNYEAKERIIKYGFKKNGGRGFLILQKGSCESVQGTSLWGERVAAIDAERRGLPGIAVVAEAVAAASLPEGYTEGNEWEQELAPEDLAEVEAVHAAVQQSLAAQAQAQASDFAPPAVRAALNILTASPHPF
jgi:hypothetical protein